jgi:hypothetical protein
MDGRNRWQSVAALAAALSAFAGFVWAMLAALWALLVATADDFPQCPEIQPEKALLVIVTLAIATLAVASVVCLYRRRFRAAFGGALVQIPLAFAWTAIDGGAAGCLIG